MTSPAFEAYLARLYADQEARARFLADPLGEAARAGLSAEERSALRAIDRVGLEFAARSFAKKRAKAASCEPRSWLGRLAAWVSR